MLFFANTSFPEVDLASKRDALASFLLPLEVFFLAKNGASVKTMRILSGGRSWILIGDVLVHLLFWSWWEVGFPRIEWMFLR